MADQYNFKAKVPSLPVKATIPVNTTPLNFNNPLRNVMSPPQQAITPPPGVSQGVTNKPSPKKKATTPIGEGGIVKDRYCVNSIPNQLEKYASVNYLFTMGCISATEFADPSSYRTNGGFTETIFASAGKYDALRVKTTHGAPEYFIENFKQHNIIVPNKKTGIAFAAKYEFEIFEPYSMGVFLQSISVAAHNKGYVNHVEAAYVIKQEFQGFDNDGTPLPSIIDPKYFVMKITSCTFTVSEAGSRYMIEAIPYNHMGFADDITMLKNDIAIVINDEDRTVKNALVDNEESLQNALNKIEQNQADTNRTAGKPLIKYKIAFAAPPDYDVDNALGQAKFKFDNTDGGRILFPHATKVINNNNLLNLHEKVLPEEFKRKVHYAQGTKIETIIIEVIKASGYIKTEVEDNKDKNEGFYRYFKIDVQEKVNELDDKNQVLSKTVTYIVWPYEAFQSFYRNTASTPIGYDLLEKNIVKEYQYMYTGYNVDVLDFEIKIANLFYQGINPTTEGNNPAAADPGREGQAEKRQNYVEVVQGNGPKTARKTHIAAYGTGNDPAYNKMQSNGTDIQSAERQIADNFHRAFVESSAADMVNIELKILGDPFWLSDSGHANYTVSIQGHQQADSKGPKKGAMNYECSDIFIYVVFRVPDDVDPDSGIYKFTQKNAYGGIYKITEVENEFSEGAFTQILKGIRMVGQSLDYQEDSGSAAQGNSKVTDTSSRQPVTTSPLDVRNKK